MRWSLRPPGRATLYRCDAAAARNPLRRCSRGRSRRGNDRSSFLECGVHENRCTTPSLQGGRRRTAERTRSRGTAVLVPGGACHASYHGLAWPFAPPRGPRSDVGTSSTPPHLPVTHPPRTATTNPPTCQVASSTSAWLDIGNFNVGSGNFSGPSAQGADQRRHKPRVIA